MKRRPLLLGYLVAVCLVAGSAIALRSTETRHAESPIPSIENSGPQGAKGLYTWLVESGADPGVLRTRYTSIPTDARVIVSLAPTRRFIGGAQWDQLRAWVAKGNTFVYGVPRRVRKQYVETSLALKWVFGPRPAPLVNTEGLDKGLRALLESNGQRDDPNGADAVPWQSSPLLAGVRTLRVSADDGLETDVPGARLIAGPGESPSVLVFPEGKGEIVVLAGSDLAENRRLALGDNLSFWANLAARGKVYFDEYHHQELAQDSRGLFAAIGPTLLQLLLAAAVLAVAMGRRLGRARPLAPAKRRSQGEYVSQLAGLYQAARLEPELCGELHRSLRRSLFERFGITAGLDDLEAARRLEQRTGIASERYLALVRRARELAQQASPAQFAQLAREFALFEREFGC